MILKLRRPNAFLVFATSILLAAVGIAMTFFVLTEKIDGMLGYILRSKVPIAVYGDCHFKLSRQEDEFYEFTTGYGDPIADVSLLFPAGQSIKLTNITPATAANAFPHEVALGNGELRYSNGFSHIDFDDGQLSGIHLESDSGIGIDFGDGNFRQLPIQKNLLFDLIGPPAEWRSEVGTSAP